MKILVTGGRGFIGTALVERLRENPSNSVCVLDLKDGWDIRVNRNHAKFDVVFHLAALRIVPTSFELDREYFDTNVYGTYKVLEWYSSEKTRIVNISTSSASNPIAPYGLTKLLAEHIAERYPNTVSLRLFNPFGPGELCPDLVIPIFANAMLKNEQVYIHSDGNQARDFTYLSDVVEEIIYWGMIEQGIGQGGIHQVGYGEPVSINMLFSVMAHYFEYKKSPIYIPRRQGDQVHTCSAHPLLIKQPIGFAEGLRRTMEWYRAL